MAIVELFFPHDLNYGSVVSFFLCVCVFSFGQVNVRVLNWINAWTTTVMIGVELSSYRDVVGPRPVADTQLGV